MSQSSEKICKCQFFDLQVASFFGLGSLAYSIRAVHGAREGMTGGCIICVLVCVHYNKIAF